MSVGLHADWHYRAQRWPHISDSGDCDVNADSAQISFSLRKHAAIGGLQPIVRWK